MIIVYSGIYNGTDYIVEHNEDNMKRIREAIKNEETWVETVHPHNFINLKNVRFIIDEMPFEEKLLEDDEEEE